MRRLVASHIGANPETQRQMIAGELQVELVPQGTLAERIRAGGFGLGGVLTRTGLGTLVEQGKTTVEIDGETWLLEKPLRADFALVCGPAGRPPGQPDLRLDGAELQPGDGHGGADGDCRGRGDRARGAIPPDAVRTPGVVVDYLLERQA